VTAGYGVIEPGEVSGDSVFGRLAGLQNKLQGELYRMKSQREAAAPAPVELLDDLPAPYLAHFEDVGAMLSVPLVRDRAADALRELISAVILLPTRAAGTGSNWKASCWRC
jgi:hypothetical protein